MRKSDFTKSKIWESLNCFYHFGYLFWYLILKPYQWYTFEMNQRIIQMPNLEKENFFILAWEATLNKNRFTMLLILTESFHFTYKMPTGTFVLCFWFLLWNHWDSFLLQTIWLENCCVEVVLDNIWCFCRVIMQRSVNDLRILTRQHQKHAG